VQQDGSVRNGRGEIISYQYGDDSINPRFTVPVMVAYFNQKATLPWDARNLYQSLVVWHATRCRQMPDEPELTFQQIKSSGLRLCMLLETPDHVANFTLKTQLIFDTRQKMPDSVLDWIQDWTTRGVTMATAHLHEVMTSCMKNGVKERLWKAWVTAILQRCALLEKAPKTLTKHIQDIFGVLRQCFVHFC